MTVAQVSLSVRRNTSYAAQTNLPRLLNANAANSRTVQERRENCIRDVNLGGEGEVGREGLQLRLVFGSGLHHLSDVAGGLVEEEGHALAAEVLADDVELDAVLVDHVGHSMKPLAYFTLRMCGMVKDKTYPHPSLMTCDHP